MTDGQLTSGAEAPQDSVAALATRLDFMGLDEAARARLAQVQRYVDKNIPVALQRFYEKLSGVPAVSRFFTSGTEQMKRAEDKQAQHWKAIAAGRFDATYYEASRTVGLVHARIGLEPRWHIGGYGVIVDTLVRGIVKDYLGDAVDDISTRGRFGGKPKLDPARLADEADALGAVVADVVRAVLLDIDIGVSSYFEKVSSEAAAKEAASAARITQAVEATGAVLKEMARGNLASRVDIDLDGGLQQDKDDTNAVADRLAETGTRLRYTSRQLKTATG